MRWDIRTTTGDETCTADEYAIDASGALLFYIPETASDGDLDLTLVIAFGPVHWVHFAPHIEDAA